MKIRVNRSSLFNTILLMSIFSIISCDREGPKEDAVLITVETDEPLNYMKHWHDADNGLLARFGENSEIGAMFHYGPKDAHRFIFIDGTGKKFINDEGGTLTGPFDIIDLFRETSIHDLSISANASDYAKSLDSFGVEAAFCVYQKPGAFATIMEVVTKTGEIRGIYDFSGGSFRTFNSFLTYHSSASKPIEAMMWYTPESDSLFKAAIVVDQTGEYLYNGNGTSLGTVKNYWQNISSKKVEAMCYFYYQDQYKTTIRVLGADGNISNGRYMYITTEDPINGPSHILTDLKKSY